MLSSGIIFKPDRAQFRRRVWNASSAEVWLDALDSVDANLKKPTVGQVIRRRFSSTKLRTEVSLMNQASDDWPPELIIWYEPSRSCLVITIASASGLAFL